MFLPFYTGQAPASQILPAYRRLIAFFILLLCTLNLSGRITQRLFRRSTLLVQYSEENIRGDQRVGQ